MRVQLFNKRINKYALGMRVRPRLILHIAPVMAVIILSVFILSLFNQPTHALGGQEKIAYYGNWDIYGNNVSIKSIDDSGAVNRLTTLVYSFENINPSSLQCFQDVVPVDNSATSESNPAAGDGGADAWADYQRPFTAAESVDGVADSPTQPLRGNLNQLKKLKQEHPNLKIMLSIGG